MSEPKHGAPPDALHELLPEALRPLCHARACARGETLFKQGRKPVQMFFVCAGEVVLQRLGAHGEAVVLQRARHGFVAEASLQSAHYHCDAVVTRSGELVSIPREPIRQALLSDAAFAGRWVAMLNREVKRLRAQCERLSKRSVAARLLHLIETEGDQGRLALGSGLKSIAAELGVTHEALYRAVAELERSSVVARRDGHLVILRAAPPTIARSST